MAVPCHSFSYLYLRESSSFASKVVPSETASTWSSFGSFAREQSPLGSEAVGGGSCGVLCLSEDCCWSFLEMSVDWRKSAQPEIVSGVLFEDLTEDCSPGDSLSENSEKLLSWCMVKHSYLRPYQNKEHKHTGMFSIKVSRDKFRQQDPGVWEGNLVFDGMLTWTP